MYQSTFRTFCIVCHKHCSCFFLLRLEEWSQKWRLLLPFEFLNSLKVKKICLELSIPQAYWNLFVEAFILAELVNRLSHSPTTAFRNGMILAPYSSVVLCHLQLDLWINDMALLIKDQAWSYKVKKGLVYVWANSIGNWNTPNSECTLVWLHSISLLPLSTLSMLSRTEREL